VSANICLRPHPGVAQDQTHIVGTFVICVSDSFVQIEVINQPLPPNKSSSDKFLIVMSPKGWVSLFFHRRN